MWNPNDFCDPDSGFDYIFSRLSAIYGSAFTNHWRDIDPAMIRQEWKFQLGNFITYRPTMDYAISMLDGERIPNAIKFRKLCNDAPAIPAKPAPQITKQKTQAEIAEIERNKAIALEKLRQLGYEFGQSNKRRTGGNERTPASMRSSLLVERLPKDDPEGW